MPPAVAGKKRDAFTFQSADDKSIGRIAEWSFYFYLFNIRQLRHLIESAATDDSKSNLRRHFFSLIAFKRDGFDPVVFNHQMTKWRLWIVIEQAEPILF